MQPHQVTLDGNNRKDNLDQLINQVHHDWHKTIFLHGLRPPCVDLQKINMMNIVPKLSFKPGDRVKAELDPVTHLPGNFGILYHGKHGVVDSCAPGYVNGRKAIVIKVLLECYKPKWSSFIGTELRLISRKLK